MPRHEDTTPLTIRLSKEDRLELLIAKHAIEKERGDTVTWAEVILTATRYYNTLTGA